MMNYQVQEMNLNFAYLPINNLKKGMNLKIIFLMECFLINNFNFD
jgi:hypothetical protein